MNRIIITVAFVLTFVFLFGCVTPRPEPAELKGHNQTLVELRANKTYFGTIRTRSGSDRRGFITWESQHDQFIIRRFKPSALTIQMPSKEVTRISFRELTEEETRMIKGPEQ